MHVYPVQTNLVTENFVTKSSYRKVFLLRPIGNFLAKRITHSELPMSNEKENNGRSKNREAIGQATMSTKDAILMREGPGSVTRRRDYFFNICPFARLKLRCQME